MRTSEKGLALIKSFEGCLKPAGNGQFKPYYCPAGVLTIGWGHTNDGGRPFDRSTIWSQEECDHALADDMVRYEQMVERNVKVPLSQGQFDALVSFTYNCGEGNLKKSTLLRCVNSQDWEGAANAFAAWNKGGGKVLPGLTRRRAAEAKMFRDGSAEVPISPSTEPMPQRVDPPAEDDAPPPAPVPTPVPAPLPEPKPGFFGRLRNWIVGAATSAGFGGLTWLTDYKVAVVFFVFVFLMLVSGITFIIWFFGAEPVRQWVRRNVA